MVWYVVYIVGLAAFVGGYFAAGPINRALAWIRGEEKKVAQVISLVK